MLQHNGSNGYNLAKVLIDTENDLAVGVFTNVSGMDAETALGEIQGALFRQFLTTP
tara:strand:- start:11387 stop:11554 length:168 start_codon:yes stop_codon:yes gene_type:complete